MALKKILKALRIDNASIIDMQGKISQWEGWYKGNIKDFHNYQVFNGKRKVNKQRHSLNMAKTVAESFADLLLNEKVNFTLKGSNAELIEEVLKDNNFRVEGNRLIELAFALGSGAFVLSLDDVDVNELGEVDTKGGKVNIKYVKAGDMYPIEDIKGNVCGLAVRTGKSVNTKAGVKEFHLLTVIEKGSGWTYINRLFDDKGRELSLEEMMLYFPEIVRYLTLPFDFHPFIIIKPNIVNNYDTYSPYGVSVYAGSIDVLKEVDTVFDSLVNEFSLGKKRIFIDENVLSFSESGEARFDDNDIVFYTLGGLVSDGEGKVGESIKESDFKLRVDEHIRGLRLGLDTLSRKVGLGGNYFNYDENGAVTATEVVSRNSELYRSISKHSILLREGLKGLVQSINGIINGINGTTHELNVAVDFDDSIIEDEGAIERRALVEFNAGVIDLHEYIKITRGYDDKMASEFVAQMNKRKQEEDIEVNEDGSEV